MALTAAAGRLLTLEEVQEAFIDRSRMLVRGDFVEAYLGHDRSLPAARSRRCSGSPRTSPARPTSARPAAGCMPTSARCASRPSCARARIRRRTKLAALAELQRAVFRCGFVPEEAEPIAVKIGEIGGLVEADAGLAQALAKANAPVVNRLTLLLRLAAGETAPRGAAAERAKTETMRLMRAPEIRAEIAKTPDAVTPRARPDAVGGPGRLKSVLNTSSRTFSR